MLRGMDPAPPLVTSVRTGRRRAGDRAEGFVADRLADAGWHILGRQVPVGRDEVDLVAIEPGDPATLVFLEVRSSRDGRFGAPEESVVGRKAARTYRAVLALLHAGVLPDGRALPRLAWRVDVVSVMGLGAPSGDAGPNDPWPTVRVRHLRAVEPG
jgi:Holliday junction resolvase-like predicted endonuclease